MVILIDPPVWPAHGTTFSHLVSDESVDELHAFAARSGIRPRAFDVDHYDVPAERYESLISLGAEPVSGRALVRRLVAGGVRVPARDRPKRARLTLVRRWTQLGLPAVADELRDELLDAWSSSGRHYHDVTHLLSVLDAIDRLRARAAELGVPVPEADLRAARLAAWFHDAVYEGVAGDDERRSAELAVSSLTGLDLDAELVSEVERLVLATLVHEVEPGDVAGQLLMDADLAVLARTPGGYERYVALVRQDYAQVSAEQWRVGRSRVLRGLLASPRLFVSPSAPDDWEQRARENLERELASLDAAAPASG